MGEKKKGERGLYQRGDTWGISYYFNGKHIRRSIGTKTEARLPDWNSHKTSTS